MKPVETVSVYPAIASIIEETINLLQGEENPYPYKRWNTLRKKIHINKRTLFIDGHRYAAFFHRWVGAAFSGRAFFPVAESYKG